MLDMLVEALTRLFERTDSRIHRNLHAKLTLYSNEGKEESYNVITRKQRPLVRFTTGNLKQHHAARDGRKTQQGNDTSLRLVFCRKPGSPKSRDELDCSEWHVKQHRFQLVEAKGLDYQRAKGCDTTAWNATLCK